MSKWIYETHYYPLTLWEKLKLWCKGKSSKNMVRKEFKANIKIDLHHELLDADVENILKPILKCRFIKS